MIDTHFFFFFFFCSLFFVLMRVGNGLDFKNKNLVKAGGWFVPPSSSSFIRPLQYGIVVHCVRRGFYLF